MNELNDLFSTLKKPVNTSESLIKKDVIRHSEIKSFNHVKQLLTQLMKELRQKNALALKAA
jgi:hypothetical protein